MQVGSRLDRMNSLRPQADGRIAANYNGRDYCPRRGDCCTPVTLRRRRKFYDLNIRDSHNSNFSHQVATMLADRLPQQQWRRRRRRRTGSRYCKQNRERCRN